MSPVLRNMLDKQVQREPIVWGALSGIAQHLNYALQGPTGDLPPLWLRFLRDLHKQATDALDDARKIGF